MAKFISIADTLKQHGVDYPEHLAIKFLTPYGYEILTYGELDKQARLMAHTLQQHYPYYDECAVILLPPGLDYIIAFFACLYSGVIAVPIYPPKKSQQPQRVEAILQDSQAKFIITDQLIANDFPHHTVINTDFIKTNTDDSILDNPLTEDKIAFLQYTSGSTSIPKGVLISHQNIVSNINVIQNVFSGYVHKVCTWLPPYHDMGLIGGILTTLHKKIELTLIPPNYFLYSPWCWLDIISQEKINITVAPNFAFDLCVQKITPEQINTLDLSCLECIYNGSEPIQSASIQRFIQTFARAGLSPQAIFPCYGLAEATLMLTAKRFKDQNSVLKLDTTEYARGKIAILPELSGQSHIKIVNCGTWQKDHLIRIVDPNTLKVLPENTIGEIWASGSSIAQGYWNQPLLTKQIFGNHLNNDPSIPYLRTGDLGFLNQENLYVTGRIKDLIIINGMNYYPQDLEQLIIQSATEFESCSAAAFSIEMQGVEKLVILQEVKRTAIRTINSEELFSTIRAVLLAQFGLIPQCIVLLKPYTLPKTSSGKIQRQRARKAFMANGFENIASWDNPTTKEISINEPSSSEAIKQWLSTWFSRRLNMLLTDHDYEKTLSELGVNSMSAVELSDELQNQLSNQTDLLSLFEQCSLNELINSLSKNSGLTKPQSIQNNNQLLTEKFDHFDVSLLPHLKNMYFNVNDGISNNTTIIDEKEYINFSGYNYLGLSGNSMVTEAVIDAVKKLGTSVSASRLVSGEKSLHLELEKAIADLVGAEDCVIFPSGYATNITIITHLFGKGDLILHDELAHNSILQGALFSKADHVAFPHNDDVFVENYLEKYRAQYNKVLIVTEGVFSMDGDIPDIPTLVALKKQFDAYLMIDEAHSMGVIGNTGRGIREYFNLDARDIDLWMGTLSKSFASCGGYLAGSQSLIDNFKYTSAGFIYSAGISPANTAAALAAIQVMNNEPQRITQLHEKQSLLLSLLKSNDIPSGLSGHTPIIPIIVGDDSRAIQLSQYLKQHHILALPIIYPAVEKNKARLRFFINCLHTTEQLYQTADILKHGLEFLNKEPCSARPTPTLEQSV